MKIQAYIDGRLAKVFDFPDVDEITQRMFPEGFAAYVDYRAKKVGEYVKAYNQFVRPVLDDLKMKTFCSFLVFESKMNSELFKTDDDEIYPDSFQPIRE